MDERENLRERASVMKAAVLGHRVQTNEDIAVHGLLTDIVQYLRPIPAEIEGDGHMPFWWYVCGECHGTIDENDKYCKHCGCAVDWGNK